MQKEPDKVGELRERATRRDVLVPVLVAGLGAVTFWCGRELFSRPTLSDRLNTLRQEQQELLQCVTALGQAGLFGKEGSQREPLDYTLPQLNELASRCSDIVERLDRFEANAFRYLEAFGQEYTRLDVAAHAELLRKAPDVRDFRLPDLENHLVLSQLRRNLQYDLLSGRDKIYRYQIVSDDPLALIKLCRSLKEGRNHFITAARLVARMTSLVGS